MAARGRGFFSLYIYIENFKNLLVRNHWTDFHILLQKCSFGDPLPRLFEPFGFVKKHGRQGQGLFSLYIYIENLKNLLVRNHQTDFNIILQKCSFGDPLPRLFKPFGFVKKHGRQGVGLIFPTYLHRKLKKSSCQKPLDQLLYNFAEIYFFGDSVPRLFNPFGFVKKHGRQGLGLIFPLYLYRKLEKSSCQKPLDQFHYNLAKMFPWWPCTKIVQVIVIHQKTWPLGAGLIFPIYLYKKTLKIFF